MIKLHCLHKRRQKISEDYRGMSLLPETGKQLEKGRFISTLRVTVTLNEIM